MSKITTALIACAGFGTRFLPISKTIQKEMLPILNRPLIDYVVADCVAAGIEEIIFVVNEHNYQVMHFYQENHRLRQYLEEHGKAELYAQIADLHQRARFRFIKQTASDPYGTAAVLQLAREQLQEQEAFLVLTGDDFIFAPAGPNPIAAMLTAYEASGAAGLVTCVEKPTQLLHKYGVVSCQTRAGRQYLQQIVEKPAPGTAPSNLVNISKYILPASVWPILERQQPDPRLGELLITDTIQQLAATEEVLVHVPQGEYLDGGYPLAWLLANLTVAKQDPELWAAVRAFVKAE